MILFDGCTRGERGEVKSIQWTVAGTIPADLQSPGSLGIAGPVSGIHRDMLLVGGGCNFPDSMPWLGGVKRYYDVIHVLAKGENAYQPLKEKQVRLPYPVAYGACCSTAGGVVCAGGENESGYINSVLLLRWDEEKERITIDTLSDLPFAISNAAISALDNKVYVAGGETKDGPSRNFLSLDLNLSDSKWQVLPLLPKPVSHAVLTTQSCDGGKSIYLIGGRMRNANELSTLYASTYKFDFNSNNWIEKAPLPYPLSAGTGVAADGCSILLFGGDRGETFHKTEELIAASNLESDPSKREMLIQRRAEIQSNHPGFSNEVLNYNTTADEWSRIETIPFASPVTTTVFMTSDNELIIPGGEIRAGVRTNQLLRGTLFFSDLK